MRVKATREGLIGHKTSTGYVIDTSVSFVALPSVAALYRFVKIANPSNGRTCYAQVLDVGPWNTHDDAYVFQGARPMSESGRKISPAGLVIDGNTNGAGIDLGERVWNSLGMNDNGQVDWEFLP